MIHV
jgi:hypothetical protein